MAEINNPEFGVRRLDEHERIESFDCGDADLNDFIMNESFIYRNELLAVSYVVEDAFGKVLAYFSLANDKISLSEFENKTEFNRFRKKRFVNEKRLKSYPAVKICRFGVDVSTHNLHIDAVPFYLKNNFLELTSSDEDASHTRLLYYDLKMMV